MDRDQVNRDMEQFAQLEPTLGRRALHEWPIDDLPPTGTNGYLANGRRVQVPDWNAGPVCRVREYKEPELSLASHPDQYVDTVEHVLRRLRCFIPPGVLGPVEGDGSWFDDDRTGGRIVTLWVEAGSAMWLRLHRRDRGLAGDVALEVG